MERRQEPRIDISGSVKVTLLGSEDCEFSGELVSLSGGGAILQMDTELPASSAIRIDIDDALLLGEVRWCRRDGARFSVGLSVEHWLPDLKVLEQMKQEVLGLRP